MPENKAEEKPKKKSGFKDSFFKTREKVWIKRAARVRLHTSFKRSYREDYVRPLEAPGLLHHAMTTLKLVFKKWRLFVPLILIVVGLNIVLVGLMSESTYVTFQDTLEETNEYVAEGRLGQVAKASLLLISTVTSGGLSSGTSEVQQIFSIFLFIIVWLVTIYLIRHIMAGNKPKLRDGLYNALSPLLSTLMVFVVVFIHLIPIFVVVIGYSAAVSTGFLSTPLYAFIFWLFSAGLILLSCYLLPGSVLGLVAVSAPGMYPMAAVNTASDLIQGRRTKFIIRLIFAIFFLAVIWVVVMLPLILLDLVIKEHVAWMAGVPVVPFLLLTMTTFTFVYVSAYVYLYYRRMLDDPN
ncbi:MAG: hypothetical protein ACK5MU_00970 [Candidatus Saccharimonadales bacterium]